MRLRNGNVGSLVERDFRRLRPEDEFTWLKALSTATREMGFLAVLLYRLEQHSSDRGKPRRAKCIAWLNLAITGADFVPGCQFGAGLLVNHPSGIVVGRGTTVGADCTMLQQVTLGEARIGSAGHEYPVVGDRVILGAGSKVLGGLRLGDDVKVGANSVVLKDVPDGATVVGAPARILKRG